MTKYPGDIMLVDGNEFFRQATVRICSSLDIEVALKRMQQYVIVLRR
jgi:predicted lipase